MKKLYILMLLALAFYGCNDSPNTPPQIYEEDTTNIKFVVIGTQVWTAKNLDVTHYRNGDSIPQITDDYEWRHATYGAWCWYNNDSTLGAIYGRLYNWYAASDPRGIAPEGWHVPTKEELDTLHSFLGSFGGLKLKEVGYAHWLSWWDSTAAEATDDYGFTALPAGVRNEQGAFEGLYGHAEFWSSDGSQFSGGYGGYQFDLTYGYAGISYCYQAAHKAQSIRLIKGN